MERYIEISFRFNAKCSSKCQIKQTVEFIYPVSFPQQHLLLKPVWDSFKLKVKHYIKGHNILSMMKYLIPFPILLLFILQSCLNEGSQALIGAKIYEHQGSYDLLFQQWNQMGINTGFCSEELISDPEFMREAREHQVSTFVIFPVYYNPEEIARTPHLAAINRNGEAA